MEVTRKLMIKVFFNDFAIKDWGDEIFVKVNLMLFMSL